MKIGKFKAVTLMSVVASVVLMSGCGGDDGDTTPPSFTSQALLNVNENSSLNHTVVATDATTVSYSKDGGTNEALFEIDNQSGVLTFNAPDVEENTDYEVIIKATDEAGNSSSQIITVTVTTVADTTPPTFTSLAELNITENLTLTYNVTATDAGGSVSYSKDTTTANSTLFTITPTGVLTFNAPSVSVDSDYDIKIKATDPSNNSNTQNITITVKDAGSVTNRAIMPLDTTGLFSRDADKNIVTNSKTGFIWEDTIDNDDNKTFAQAQAHCESLKSSGFAGINDWRLPSRADLFKLVDHSSVESNYIDDTFVNRSSWVYWSDEEEDDKVWGVSYIGGSGDFRVDKTLTGAISSASVRCVSGDHQPPNFSGTHTSQTRVDADTTLEWQTHVHNSISPSDGAYHHSMDWEGAKAACSRTTGFRLPTINELRSIVEYDSGRVFGDLTVDVVVEGVTVQESARSEANGLNGTVWTSTETSDGKVKALYIVKTGGGDTPATIKDEIYDTVLEKNATGFSIKAVCVK